MFQCKPSNFLPELTGGPVSGLNSHLPSCLSQIQRQCLALAEEDADFLQRDESSGRQKQRSSFCRGKVT